MKILTGLVIIYLFFSCGINNSDQIKLYTDSLGIVQRRMAFITDSVGNTHSPKSLDEFDPSATGRLMAEKTILKIKREEYLRKIAELKK